MIRLPSFFVLLGILGGAEPASSQTYPSRPITMIVGFAAGGPMDVVARVVAEGMQDVLGQTILVENVVGAGGSIGAGRVARAAPDGFTLSYGGWPTHVINAAVYPLSYDVVEDFEPVSLTASAPWLLLAKNEMPGRDLNGLIDWLKFNPGKASVGTGGVGSASHAIGALFRVATRTSFQLVPYRGNAPAMQDLIAGRLDMLFDSPATGLPHVRASLLKAYIVTGKSRLALAPDIPTADEAGLAGFEVSSWHAIWAPKGTPKDIIDKLNSAVVLALARPAVRKRLADLGQDIPTRHQQRPEGLAELQKFEIDKWWPIIKAGGMKGE
jgi:tripartite-type tricarboxylate transporter receptor subunit TctC